MIEWLVSVVYFTITLTRFGRIYSPNNTASNHPATAKETAMSAQPDKQNLVESIDRRLPQTQCTQCDYPGCLDYAQAIASGEAEINQCPPGGDISIDELSRLLEREARPLNPKNGVHEPLQLAFIHEADCIGCKLCIAACPVDCIVGAVKLMHTVIASDCSGCQLCLPVCPTDCITLVQPSADYGLLDGKADAPSLWPEFSLEQVEKSRRRARQKRRRFAAQNLERTKQRSARFQSSPKQEILAALKRKQQNIKHESPK